MLKMIMQCSSGLVLLLPRLTNDADMLKQKRLNECCWIHKQVQTVHRNSDGNEYVSHFTQRLFVPLQYLRSDLWSTRCNPARSPPQTCPAPRILHLKETGGQISYDFTTLKWRCAICHPEKTNPAYRMLKIHFTNSSKKSVDLNSQSGR